MARAFLSRIEIPFQSARLVFGFVEHSFPLVSLAFFLSIVDELKRQKLKYKHRTKQWLSLSLSLSPMNSRILKLLFLTRTAGGLLLDLLLRFRNPFTGNLISFAFFLSLGSESSELFELLNQ